MPNYDEKTGIHFGVISQNSIDLSVMDNWYEKDEIYESALKELKDDFKTFLQDHYLNPEHISDDEIIQEFNDHFENDNPQWYYEDKGYEGTYSSDLNCWFILKSPYFTYTKQCSPCAPCAGDLDNPVTKEEYEKTPHNTFMYGTVKAYCLPKEFFPEDIAPYEYFPVIEEMS